MSNDEPLIGRGDVAIPDPVARFSEFGDPYVTWVDTAATGMAHDVAQRDDSVLAKRRAELEPLFDSVDQRLLVEEREFAREHEARSTARHRVAEDAGIFTAREVTQLSDDQREVLEERIEQSRAAPPGAPVETPELDEVSDAVLDAHLLSDAYGKYENELLEPGGWRAPSAGRVADGEDSVEHVRYKGEYLDRLEWHQGFAEWLAVTREQDMRGAEQAAQLAQQGAEVTGVDAAGAQVRRLGERATPIAPLHAKAIGAVERVIQRDDVAPQPALEDLRPYIDPAHAEALADRLEVVESLLKDAPDEWIRRRRAELGPVDAGLDKKAALEAVRLERAHTNVAKMQRQAMEDDLALAEEDPAQAAVAQQAAAVAQTTLDDVSASLGQLHADGKHPRDWMEQNDDRVLRAIMYTDEACLRWHREAAQQAEFSVVAPPDHVVDLVGERPERPGPKRTAYDAVTRELETHRYLTESAEPAGFDPPQRSHREERQLRQQIEAVRQSQGMERGLDGPGEGRGV